MLRKLNLVLKTKVIKMVKNSWPIKDKCLQNGGAGCFTVDQEQCVFPFQYKGMQYTQCTTVSQNCNLCYHKLIWWQKIRPPMLLVWGPWHNNAKINQITLSSPPHSGLSWNWTSRRQIILITSKSFRLTTAASLGAAQELIIRWIKSDQIAITTKLFDFPEYIAQWPGWTREGGVGGLWRLLSGSMQNHWGAKIRPELCFSFQVPLKKL